MGRPKASRPASYFEAIYAQDSDPWRFATSAYERAKYEATVAALPDPRYRRGFEVGCSIGVLTRMLASRCDHLLSIDIAEKPLSCARQRCADCPQVEFARMHFPDERPGGMFDLIILSEVLFFWTYDDLDRVARFAERALEPEGDIILVHWTGPNDEPLTGDEAAEYFMSATRSFTTVLRQERAPQYHLDVLRRR